jgi:hypothetical protein
MKAEKTRRERHEMLEEVMDEAAWLIEDLYVRLSSVWAQQDQEARAVVYQ